MKKDYLHRELYLSKGAGYIEGLRDAGLLTDFEHRELKCYLTI